MSLRRSNAPFLSFEYYRQYHQPLLFETFADSTRRQGCSLAKTSSRMNMPEAGTQDKMHVVSSIRVIDSAQSITPVIARPGETTCGFAFAWATPKTCSRERRPL